MSPSKLRLLILQLAVLALVPALPAQERGTVTGLVLDAQSGAPVIGVRVAINGQSGSDTTTGTDGRFTIKLAPGSYRLTFAQERYADAAIDAVAVAANEVTEASTVMALKGAVTTVDVTEKIGAVAATAEAMLAERKLSAVVSDSISNEELRSGVASNAAGALEKVTGVSIVDNGFVYVRGLGERYSATMLNSAMIPTTEPEKRVVPLDLFPAALIENIRILKTYTPDLPGEFAGGLVQMNTVEFPAAKLFRVSISAGGNTVTTANRFSTYPGSSLDYLGFGGGGRALPAAIPEDSRLTPGSFTPQQFQDFGRAFSNNWQPTTLSRMRPNLNWSMVGGGTYGRFGIVGALTFNNRPQRQSELQRYYRQEGTRPILFTRYDDFQTYTESARLGGVLNLAIRLNAANKLVFRNTLTRDSDKEARSFTGYDGGVDSTLSSERLRYIERGLFSTSIEGDHALPSLRNSVFHWQYTYSTSSRNEPDLREVFRGQLEDRRFIFAALGSSGLRFFSDLQDRIHEPQADFSTPFYKGSLSGMFKAGFRATLRSRDFQARRFRYIPQNLSTLDLFAPSNALFAPGNIRPGGFQLTEFTRPTDRYDAGMDIFAGYAMVDLNLGGRWRLVGGLRIEDADIRVRTLDPLVANATPQVASLVNRDPTPGVNLIYALTPRQNLRGSYSRTLSRPDFRELSPFDFNNVLGGFVTQGNPNLVRATMDNYDLRWEWFRGGNQLVAASFFAKSFTNPIEVTILPANDLRQTFVNAQGARNYGCEFELRQGLGVLHRRLRQFAVQSNVTFVDSNIDLREQDAALLTSKSRPLLGQSRYLFNVITEWARPQWRSSARFYANTVSRRITDVGTFGLPDIYQERNTFLDFVYQYDLSENGRYSLRLNAENLGDNHYRWTQGGLLQRSFRLGRTFTASLSVAVF